MGKSLFVQRLAENLSQNRKHLSDCVLITIPIHGPVVTQDVILDFLTKHINKPTCCIYHIDISPSVMLSIWTVSNGYMHYMLLFFIRY